MPSRGNRRQMTWRRHAITCATLLLAACGGGGGDGTPSVRPPPPPPPTAAEMLDASRFAAGASFGMDYAGIEEIATAGVDAWLDEQFARPVTRHSPIVEDLVRRRDAGEFAAYELDIEYLIMFRRLSWWHATVAAEDHAAPARRLRADEIFVVSDNVDDLHQSDRAGRLLRHAAGERVRQLPRPAAGVTLHPVMGVYLSHVNNARPNPATNTFPDENYAREVMQLFTIGLFELNSRRSQKRDARRPADPDLRQRRHSASSRRSSPGSELRPGARRRELLRQTRAGACTCRCGCSTRTTSQARSTCSTASSSRPARPACRTSKRPSTTCSTIPNVGPFIGRQLIQRLVTSNPSPAYVERVARAFDGERASVPGATCRRYSARCCWIPKRAPRRHQSREFG